MVNVALARWTPCDDVFNTSLCLALFCYADNVLALTHRIPSIVMVCVRTTAVENCHSPQFTSILTVFGSFCATFCALDLSQNSFISFVAIQSLKSGQRAVKMPELKRWMIFPISFFLESVGHRLQTPIEID